MDTQMLLIALPGPRTYLGAHHLHPTPHVLLDRLTISSDGQAFILVAYRLGELASNLLTCPRVEALALATRQGDARFPEAIGTPRYAAFIVSPFSRHLATLLALLRPIVSAHIRV